MKNIFRPFVLLAALLSVACVPEMNFDPSSLNATGGGTITAVSDELLVRQDAIEKWDGKLPTYTGGTIPFINGAVNK